MDTLVQYLQYLVNGLTLGAIYALIALGYTMVYGILKFINFAHGDILMIGAYTGLFTYTALLGESTNAAWMLIAFFIAMLVSMAFCALLGMFIERVAYKPLRNANRLAPLLSAIGVSFILSNGAAWLFGAQSRRFPYPFDDTPIMLGGISITPHQILTVVVSVIMMVVLTLFVNRSRMGKAMRATADGHRRQQNHLHDLRHRKRACRGGRHPFRIRLPRLRLHGHHDRPEGLRRGCHRRNREHTGCDAWRCDPRRPGVHRRSAVSALKDTIAFAVLIVILLVKPDGILGKNEREKV